ncbi:MAG: glycerol-3-phosphate dehydrogenase [Proteobacteria bacterium]|nr:glycerol-3-phosphate dehydrogenase [Pseudomonadota bacterium]
MSIYDLLVVGGGINGAGIARDAAGRGLSVLLCEKDDIGSHTSSASTKLIHGGLRYLEHYEFHLVRKALQEREVLIHAAPHIIWPLRFIMPHDAHLRPAWMIRIGLFLYDNLARRELLPGSNSVDLKTHPAGAPLDRHFRRGFEYSDGWVQDARLVLLNAIDAQRRGAEVRLHTRCVAARREEGNWKVQLTDDTGETVEVAARILVNAAGPWVGQFLDDAVRIGAKRSVRLVKGSHIVVPRQFDHDYAYIFQNPDKRIIFAIPFEDDYTLIGTTDMEYHGDPDRVSIADDEIAYLCEMANRYFKHHIAPADVVWSYSGVRPLLDDETGDPSEVTRDYSLELDTHGSPLLSVFGGKLTTFRRLAEEAVDRLQPLLGQRIAPWTAAAVLPGGDLPGGSLVEYQARLTVAHPWLPASLARRWARTYGTRSAEIIGDAAALADLGQEVLPALYAREIDYLVREEWATSSDDILWRRTKLGLRFSKAEAARLDRWLVDHR